MNTLDILNELNLKHNFYEWVKSNYKYDEYNNNDYLLLNIYTKINYKFHDTLPIEFQTLKIDYNFPDYIIQENNTYVVGISKYDKNVEFFTLRIKK